MNMNFPIVPSEEDMFNSFDSDEISMADESPGLNPFALEFTPSFTNPTINNPSISSLDSSEPENVDLEANIEIIIPKKCTHPSLENEMYMAMGCEIKDRIDQLMENFQAQKNKSSEIITDLEGTLKETKENENKEITKLKVKLYDAEQQIKFLESSTHDNIQITLNLFIDHLTNLISSWVEFNNELEEASSFNIVEAQKLAKECASYLDTLIEKKFFFLQKLESYKLKVPNGIEVSKNLATLLQIPDPPFNIFSEKKLFKAKIKDCHAQQLELASCQAVKHIVLEDKAHQTEMTRSSETASTQTDSIQNINQSLKSGELTFEGTATKKVTSLDFGITSVVKREFTAMTNRQQADLPISNPTALSRCTSSESLYSVYSTANIENRSLPKVFYRMMGDLKEIDATLDDETILTAINKFRGERGGKLSGLKYKYVVQKLYSLCRSNN